METSSKPTIVVSRCLEFDSCRYNGMKIASEAVKKLKPFVDFVPVCPEVEIGLGIPRDPIRIVERDGRRRLVQPATGRDVTDLMQTFAASFFDSLSAVDGFILKNRSPSCGVRDVKIYSGTDELVPFNRQSGFFGGAVVERFPAIAVEDEGRLSNFRIREHFLTRVYATLRFRHAAAKPSMKRIVRFHSENKLLLMAYNQRELKALGRIVANHDHKPVGEVFTAYAEHLHSALRKQPRYTSNINVLMHALGYFSKELSSKEKSFFLDSLERYREGVLPLSALQYMVRSWIMRFETDYLMPQTFFMPYPEELVDITDSGKGRKL